MVIAPPRSTTLSPTPPSDGTDEKHPIATGALWLASQGQRVRKSSTCTSHDVKLEVTFIVIDRVDGIDLYCHHHTFCPAPSPGYEVIQSRNWYLGAASYITSLTVSYAHVQECSSRNPGRALSSHEISALCPCRPNTHYMECLPRWQLHPMALLRNY